MAKQPIETVDPRTLVPHPENPRRGDVAGVTRSIRDNGWWGVVIAQRSTGRILAGHTRTAAAIEAGLESVPVFWLDVDDDGARRVLLADNRWADVATYDPAGLAALLGSLDADALGSVGYTIEDLRAVESLLGFAGVDPEAPPLAHRLAVVDAVPTIQATIIATRSMNINPWIPATKPAATIMKTSGEYMALVEPVPESDLTRRGYAPDDIDRLLDGANIAAEADSSPVQRPLHLPGTGPCPTYVAGLHGDPAPMPAFVRGALR